MIRGTTPTLTCECGTQSLDLTTCHGIIVKITQMDDVSITLTGARLDISAHKIECFLTQEQSLSLCEGEAELQIHGLTEGNVRWASDTIPITIKKTNYEEEIT